MLCNTVHVPVIGHASHFIISKNKVTVCNQITMCCIELMCSHTKLATLIINKPENDKEDLHYLRSCIFIHWCPCCNLRSTTWILTVIL